MTPVSHGKPCAGNPHARFEEGASASQTPRRNALLHSDENMSLPGRFAVYGTVAGKPAVVARFEDNDVWLTQK